MWLKLIDETRSLELRQRSGRNKKVEDKELKDFVKQNPEAFLKDIGKHFGVSYQTVFRRLRALKITRKKNTLYFERDAAKRDWYLKQVHKLKWKDFFYLDESGFDHTLHSVYAHSIKGRRIIGEVSGQFRNRISIVLAYCQNKFIAPMTFSGYCNTDTFNTG